MPADAFANVFAAVFEFEEGDRNPVHVQHNIGAFFVFALDGDFLGDRKVVLWGILPVDELDGLGVFAGAGFDLDAVAEEFINFFVVVVEASVGVVGFGAEFVEGLADLGRGVVLLGKVAGEQGFFNVAVVGAILSVAEVLVAEFVAEELDDTVLGDSFGLSNTHVYLCNE